MKITYLTTEQHIAVNNEWMRRYIEQPDQFAHEWATIQEFLGDENANQTPNYGAHIVAYTEKIADDLFGPSITDKLFGHD